MNNIIGYIQRGIKLDKIYGNMHKYYISQYFKEIPRFKKITKEDIMRAMQRMVRAKYKGYKDIKFSHLMVMPKAEVRKLWLLAKGGK